MPEFGPFSVDPSQVAGLSGGDFADLIGRLLAAERAQAGLDGAVLTMTYRTNAGDGGVDAHLRRATATDWIPAGESVWQFKAGDLGPESCKVELRGATTAVESLRRGGKYRLALGKSITPAQIIERREALESVAKELDIPGFDDQFEVLNGDSLARWTEEFPAVASSPTIRGMGIIGQTFDEWSNSIVHQTAWVPSDARTRQIGALRQAVQEGDELGVHVEGVSGLGKTRLVMEAFRGQDKQALVVYIPSEDQFDPSVLSRLHQQGRAAVVVIDECDAKRHDVFAAMLQRGTRIRLVTISEPTTTSTRAPVLLIQPFDDVPLTDLLMANEPGLWPEAARVIVEVASGNIDYALKCAKALITQQPGSAGQMVNPGDIRQFIAKELPGGTLFLASCALALLSRIGFDGELAKELTTLSTGLSVPEGDLRAAAALLGGSGLITVQGRYRSVGPHPVAIHLASRGWTEFGTRILTDLLPILSEDQTERLFARATEVGDRALPRAVVEQMLGDDGVLASLESITKDRRGRMLQHLAVLAPDRVARRIAQLVAGASDAELREAVGARRPLIWALQKLVWHSGIFEQAADTMLRLAIAENESYSNNATGEWVDLFATFLPSTAATPGARIHYLRERSASDDPRVRRIVVEAAKRALSAHDFTLVSGELQGGVIVEPRGGAADWHEAGVYQNSILDILRTLVDDSGEEVAGAALNALIESIQPSLEIEPVRDHLSNALATLAPAQLRRVRAQLTELEGLYDRSDDDLGVVQAIRALLGSLPDESPNDRLWRILHSPAWDLTSSQIEDSITTALQAQPSADVVQALLDALSESIPTDFSVGHVLAGYPSDRVAKLLTAQLDGPNSRALPGYLLGLEEAEEGAFDRFVDELEVDDNHRLRLTAQGPGTDRAVQRLGELLPRLPVASGARAIFFWARNFSDEATLRGYLDDWLGRIESQDDYNAVVDFLALQLHRRSKVSEALEDEIGRVVELRSQFPAVGHQEHDWEVLAKQQLEHRPMQLTRLLVHLVETDSIRMHPGSSGAELLRRAVERSGPTAWQSIMTQIVEPESFRMAFATRGWLADAVDVGVATTWVGDSVDRAVALGSVASVGGSSLGPVARFLLNNFGDDDRISSSLVGRFMTGSWTGNESSRIERQIAQVRGWLGDSRATEAEKEWCRRLIETLEGRLSQVLREEQEERW